MSLEPTPQTRSLPSSLIQYICSYNLYSHTVGECDPIKLYCYKVGDSNRTPFCLHTSVEMRISKNYAYSDVSYMRLTLNWRKYERSGKQIYQRFWQRICKQTKQISRRFRKRTLRFMVAAEDISFVAALLPPHCKKIDCQVDVIAFRGNLTEFRDYILLPNVSMLHFNRLDLCQLPIDQTLAASIRSKVRGTYICNGETIPVEKIPLIESLEINSLLLEDSEKWFKLLQAIAPNINDLEIGQLSPEIVWPNKISFPKLHRLRVIQSHSLKPIISILDKQRIGCLLLQHLRNAHEFIELTERFDYIGYLHVSFCSCAEQQIPYEEANNIVEFISKSNKIADFAVSLDRNQTALLDLLLQFSPEKSLRVDLVLSNRQKNNKSIMDKVNQIRQKPKHMIFIWWSME